MRRLTLVVISLLLVASPADAWSPPVRGRVVRPFAAPRTRFGRGHRGVDFAVARRTPVHPIGPGTVVFAGAVGGTLHVVVRHANGMRTSYDFLASVGVRAGARVTAATVLGRSGGRGDGHPRDVVHLGLRIGDRYVDPMRLFGPRTPPVVHLAPLVGSADAIHGPDDSAESSRPSSEPITPLSEGATHRSPATPTVTSEPWCAGCAWGTNFAFRSE